MFNFKYTLIVKIIILTLIWQFLISVTSCECINDPYIQKCNYLYELRQFWFYLNMVADVIE